MRETLTYPVVSSKKKFTNSQKDVIDLTEFMKKQQKQTGDHNTTMG